MTVYRHYRERTDSFGDYAVFRFGQRDHLRSQMLSDIHTLSAFFVNQGLRAGDVYTIMLPPMAEGIIIFYALNRLGVRVNFINPNLPQDEFIRILDETHTKGIALVNLQLPDYTNVIKTRHLPILLCADSAHPTLSHNADRLPTTLPHAAYEKILVEFANFPTPPEVIEPKDVALYLQGGGTTGTSKTIVLTNTNIIAVLEALKHCFGADDIRGRDATLICMPLFHVYGLVNIAFEALVRGLKAIFMPKFDADTFIALMRDNHVVQIRGVPSLFQKLLEHPQWNGPHLKSLKAVHTGGDDLTDALCRRVDATLRQNGSLARLTQGYGMTECGSVALIHDPAKRNDDLKSLGSPITSLTVEIWDDANRPVSEGTIGEIVLSGPTVMRGYLNDDDSSDVGLHVDERGRRWMMTGDLGYRKGDLFYFAGRKKRIIIIAGNNAYPLDIEKAALDTGVVKEACAVQGFDSRGRILIRLFVVPLSNLMSDALVGIVETISSACNAKLEEKTRPRDIRLLKALPRTHAGKIDFKLLTQTSSRHPVYTD